VNSHDLMFLSPQDATDAAIGEGSHDALKALSRYFATKAASTLLNGSCAEQRDLVTSMRIIAVQILAEVQIGELGLVYANRILGMALVLIAPH